MSPTVVRLMLSLTLMTAVTGLFIGLYNFLYYGPPDWGDGEAVLVATLICAFALVIGWVSIWVRAVPWNPRRVWLTAVAGAAPIVPAVFVGAVLFEMLWEPGGVLAAGLIWAVGWMLGTSLAWCETKAERATRWRGAAGRVIACPKCGYNLAGLSQSICPECGASYTLDQLFASVAEAKGTLPEEARP